MGFEPSERVTLTLGRLEAFMAEHIYPIFLVWEHPWYAAVLPWLHGEPGLESLIGHVCFLH